MSDQNLSEVLFKPKFDYPETSMISNSGVELPFLTKQDRMLGFNKHYYRALYRFLWGLSGGNPLDIDEALAMKKEIPEYEYQIAKNLSI